MVLHIVVDMMLSLAVSISSSLFCANSISTDKDEKVPAILLREDDVPAYYKISVRNPF